MTYLKKPLAFIAVFAILLLLFPQVNARAPGHITIPVTHKIDGIKSTSEIFKFNIKKVTEEAPLPKETTLQIKGNGTANFDIDFDDVGRYEYEIREEEGKTKSTTYDKKVYKVIVAATFDENDEIATYAVYEDGTKIKPEKVIFTDLSQQTVFVKPMIKKKIPGKRTYGDKFRFRIKGEGIKKTCSIRGEGKVAFPQLSFTKEGVYKFSVYELKDKPSNWNYDTKKYKYKVTVTENDGKLYVSTNYKTMTFKNKPTLLRKAKKLVSNGAKTSDFNHYIGIVALIGIALLITSIIAAKSRNRY